MNDREQQENRYSRMKKGITLSVILHVSIILALVIGWPYIHKKREAPQAIAIEVATIADITQSDKPPVETKKEPEPKEQPPEIKQPPKPKANTAPEPPKPVEKKPEKVEKKPEVVKDPPKPKEDELAQPKKKPKPPEKKEKPKEQPKPADDAFSSMLKNLSKDEPVEDIKNVTDKIVKSAPSPATPTLGATISMSEMDALRQQLSGCWNVIAGAAEAEGLAVEVRIIVNQDRTVRDATILDQNRYNTDSFFRAAADSALRAVWNPQCSPLNLPPEKYDLWRDIIVNFDPKEML